MFNATTRNPLLNNTGDFSYVYIEDVFPDNSMSVGGVELELTNHSLYKVIVAIF